MRLCTPEASSFAAVWVSAFTADPVYAARRVSNPLPIVSNVTVAVAGAVQVAQIDRPPVLPAWLGSPLSFVAPTVVALIVPLRPASARAAANMSFATPLDPPPPDDAPLRLQLTTTEPAAPK